ncbi:MAG TPA: M24 family metallopeptidase [Verrucomicrobiae bacterium]|jgi:Xaa-Pro aminopeptidase|nr:M24 family metallopeptidase [Verrucomicrobiae bacterium]
MNRNRRDILKSGSLALLGGGLFRRMDKIDGMQTEGSGGSLAEIVKRRSTGASEKLLLGPAPGEEGPPEPAKVDRLPLEWNKQTVARFKEQLAQKDIHAFVARDQLNIIYLTGYWHTHTERPQVVFMNKDDADPWFLYPALDRDLVKGWWFGGGWEYFDTKHAEGGFPEQGKVAQGKTVDLFQMLLEGIKAKGVQGNKIGIDGKLYADELATAKKVLPKVKWVDVSDTLLDMREIKTPEELALTRRAYTYFDRAHAYARDYILTYGTDVTDYEVAFASTFWINNVLLADLDLAGGLPHHGVAAGVEIDCRVGRLCAYPHPNQPRFNRIQRSMPLQVDGDAYIGGHGGENYRMYILADNAGEFDAHMRKLWEVSQHTCDMQVELQKEGATCSSVAYEIHKYQVAQGVEDYIYHRPAHGEGSEGHQPPYMSLGDYTVLKKNMCFSEEPGLYDPKAGVGFNWSDHVVTGVKSGYRMSRVPYTKEWSWVKI